jgi:hypothetical protein
MHIHFLSIGLKGFHSTSIGISTLLEKVMQVPNSPFVLFVCLFVLNFSSTKISWKLDMMMNQLTSKYSVSGHYVPQLSQIVYQRNKGIRNPAINFKGFLVGM